MKLLLTISFFALSNLSFAMDNKNDVENREINLANRYTLQELEQQKKPIMDILCAFEYRISHLCNNQYSDPYAHERYNQFWIEQLELQKELLLLDKAMTIKKLLYQQVKEPLIEDVD